LALLFTAGTIPAAAFGGEAPEALRDWVRADPDQQAVDSLDFILSLSLTREQARSILPLYVDACRVHMGHYLDTAEIQPLEIQAYTAFLEEDRLNQGFSPEVERFTARIHRRTRVAREEMTGELNELADQVRAILTPAQRAFAEDYKPKREAVIAAFGTRSEQQKVARRAERRVRRGPPRPHHNDPELTDAQMELDALSRAVHPRLDVTAKHLLTPATAESLYGLADMPVPKAVREAVDCWRSGTRYYSLEQCKHDRQRLRALRKEINHWNLANGMHFDPEQIEQLVGLAKEAERLRTAQRQAKPKYKLSPEAFNAELVGLELAAELVLRPGQLEVMRTYKPCLIPPKNLKDPVRVGQASGSTRMGPWLANARRKPDRQVERMIDRLMEKETAHLGPMDEAALQQRRNLLRETARHAAEMSDVEFALNKDELAEAIRPPNRKEELGTDINAMRRERLQPGRTSRFLLNRGFADVLEARYEQLNQGSLP
jgi:hypothetical protein